MNDQEGTNFQQQWLEDLARYLQALKDELIHPADRTYYISMIKRELEEVRDRINTSGRYRANQPRANELLASIEEVGREEANKPPWNE